MFRPAHAGRNLRTMKTKHWLIWSLALNGSLGVALFLATHPSGKESQPGPAISIPAADHSARPASLAPTAPQTDDSWRQWLGPLRAGGVPDNVLAGLVSADFENRWQEQRRDLQRRYERGEIDDDTITRFVEAHDTGQEQELRYALGADGYVKWDKQNVLRALNADKVALSAAESDMLYGLKKNLAQQEADLVAAHQAGEIDEADLDRRQADAEKDYEAKAKTLLGDARYTTWKTPVDAARGQLARTLKTLSATDAQVQAMLAAQQRWDEQRAKLGQQPADQDGANERQMRTLDATRDADYRRILGEQGFAQLQASQDGRYQTMRHYAAAWQLAGPDVDHIYGALHQSQQSVDDYRQRARELETHGEMVDWPAVDANIQAYTWQTRQSLRQYLGEERFNKLVNNSVLEF